MGWACTSPANSGTSAPTDSGGGGPVAFEVKGSGSDAKTAPKDTASADSGSAEVDADNPPQDTAPAVTVTEIALEATDTLAVAGRAPLKVSVKRSDGSEGAPKDSDGLQFTVDGQPIELGAKLSADPAAQPKLAVWRDSKTGNLFLAGVRPGDTVLAAKVGDVAAPDVAVSVAFPDGAGLRLATTTANGKCAGDRSKDSDDTIKLEGKQFGAGGLTLTLRFPAAAVAGDVLDTEKPPKSGALQLVATVADLGGVQLKIPQARVWIDQTDKGWFRGTFLGTSATLLPVAGTFAVARDGKFGIDLLDDGQQIQTSTTQSYKSTGNHYSRVSVSAVPGGVALLHWREVLNVTTANLGRASVKADSGDVVALEPLVAKATAAVLVDDGKGTLVPTPKGEFFGAASVATSADKTLVVWEGKPAKGSAAPYQISAQLLDAKLKPTGAVLQVAPDECWGDCKPSLVPLPSSRWLAVWGAPKGTGVRGAILDGNDLSQTEKLVSMIAAPATNPSVASLDANVAVVWKLPGKGTRYRLYTDTLASNGPEQDLGTPTATPPAPQMLAIDTPPSFAAVFFSPAAELKLRRIGLNASVMGPADVPVATDATKIAAAAGKAGQLVLVERISGAAPDEPQLRLRKMVIASAGDPGTPLGPPVPLALSASKLALDAAIAYLPDADTFVVAWSGDLLSDGIWVQRFR